MKNIENIQKLVSMKNDIHDSFIKIIIIFLFCFSFVSAIAQEASYKIPGKCYDSLYRAFDFWIGDWKVFDKVGKQLGSNSITTILDGCAIQENWTSTYGNFQGSSYNFVAISDGLRHQSWIDNQGGALLLHRNLQEQKMVLESNPIKNKNQEVQIDKITWEPKLDESVI